MKKKLEDLPFERLSLERLYIIHDFIKRKKENMERLSNELHNEFKKIDRLMIYYAIYSAITIPAVIYYLFFT